MLHRFVPFSVKIGSGIRIAPPLPIMSVGAEPRSGVAAGIRATRFPVRAPVRYRCPLEDSWHHGTSVNVSRSGILLRADAFLEADTPIELILELPAVLLDEPAGTVFCRGRVVRTESLPDGERFAAEFSSYVIGRAH